MAGKIKQFIQKKKLDVKFSSAGPGHKLNEETKKPVLTVTTPAPRQPQSDASSAAGAAALSRLEPPGIGVGSVKVKQSVHHSKPPETSDIQSGAVAPDPVVQLVDSSSSNLIVYMICPFCKTNIVAEDINVHMSSCLNEEYVKEPLTASVHMIHTLTGDNEKKKLCIETINKYLDNIILNPLEDKYRKIRINNRSFQEKVCVLPGSAQFLESVGFKKVLLPHQDGEEMFYVLPEPDPNKIDELTAYKELLLSTDRLKPVLDRNPQLFRASGRMNQFDLPNSFYNMSIEEIKREQKQRSDALERESILRTKAIRERDERKAIMKYYRFILLRIRFPEQVILQGVFRPIDQLLSVRQFIVDQLKDQSRSFNLHYLRHQLQDDAATLAQLGLAPAAVLNLCWTDSNTVELEEILKTELIRNIQEL